MFPVYVVWGIATTLIWAVVLSDGYGSWKIHRDRRSKRDVLAFAAEFATALGSTAAILMVVLGEPGGTPRTVVLLAALGMFTGAGIVRLGMRKGEP